HYSEARSVCRRTRAGCGLLASRKIGAELLDKFSLAVAHHHELESVIEATQGANRGVDAQRGRELQSYDFAYRKLIIQGRAGAALTDFAATSADGPGAGLAAVEMSADRRVDAIALITPLDEVAFARHRRKLSTETHAGTCRWCMYERVRGSVG